MTTEFLRRYSAEPLDGKYQMLSVLGIGGMGEVYKARHVHLHALRVIKLMRPSIAGDREAHDRFLREARLATRIQHPNVAALFDFSALPDGSFYMVWEYIDGTNLRRFVEERQFLRPAEGVRLACQALGGLEAIHRAGVVHRDVSPENLMVSRDERGVDRIKIIDLGVAKQWDDSGDQQTQTGIFVGKFKYCSPEQLGMLKAGERIDGRADVYSFGLVLYEMLTGVAPFEAETPHQYLVMHSAQMPLPFRQVNPRAAVPPQIEAVIFRALSKERDQRFASAIDFANALEAALPKIETAVLEMPLEGDSLPPTLVSPLPAAESVADVPLATSAPSAQPTVVRREGPAGAVPSVVRDSGASPRRTSPGMIDTASGRKRDLFEQVIGAMGDEQYAKADVALQTLRMHLGARAETDPEFRRVRKELETAAAEKEAAFVAAIDRAKQEGNPGDVQRVLAERDERLGRRFGDSGLKFEVEVWLRTRTELLVKARNWIAAESFNNAGKALDELSHHLENGAAVDREYLALQQGFQQALVESSEKMRQEIVAAHVQENIGKTRRLLSMYAAKFGQQRQKPPAILAAESWIQQIDAIRAASAPKRESAAVTGARSRRRGVVATLLFLLVLAAALFAAWHWKSQTAEFVRRYTSGETQAVLLDLLQVPAQPPAPAQVPVPAPVAAPRPPQLDPSRQSAEGQIWPNPIDHLDYVWIPPGKFEMGCVSGDRHCKPADEAHRQVEVHGFWLGRTEVTVEAFARFVRATNYRRRAEPAAATIDPIRPAPSAGASWQTPITPQERAQPQWPVAWLSVDDAAAYCAWAGGRIPSDEEWEYAARSRDGTTIHSWGNEAIPPRVVANLADEASIKRFRVSSRVRRELFGDYLDGFDTYTPVGSFPPNRLGLSDLEGNVWEWSLDRDGNASLRGGSWSSAAQDVRLSARKKLPRNTATWTTGCRCVLPGQ